MYRYMGDIAAKDIWHNVHPTAESRAQCGSVGERVRRYKGLARIISPSTKTQNKNHILFHIFLFSNKFRK